MGLRQVVQETRQIVSVNTRILSVVLYLTRITTGVQSTGRARGEAGNKVTEPSAHSQNKPFNGIPSFHHSFALIHPTHLALRWRL